MKKWMIFCLMALLLVGCSEEKSNKEEVNEDDKKAESVLGSVPDFPIPLQTFIETYNQSEREGFTPIENNAAEVEFTEETNGYSKKLLDVDAESADHSITAMFDQDKRFVRISYNEVIKNEADEKAVVTLLAVFDALGIDTNYIEEFIASGNDHMDFTSGDYKVSFRNMSDANILNVAIESK